MSDLSSTDHQSATTVPKRGNRKKAWTRQEDIQLCRSWLHIPSHPTAVDTEQVVDPMWERIKDDFYANIGEYRAEDRSSKGMKNRWCMISSTVTRFCEALSTAIERKRSGIYIGEEMAEANRIFSLESKTKKEVFTMEHCWEVLHDEPKWQATMKEKEQKKRKVKELSSISDSQAAVSRSVKHGSSESSGSSSHNRSKKAKIEKGSHDIAIDRLERLYFQNERRDKLMQRSIDLKIMAVDPSKIQDPLRRRFYKLQQREVLERWELLSKEGTTSLIEEEEQDELHSADEDHEADAEEGIEEEIEKEEEIEEEIEREIEIIKEKEREAEKVS